jgi:HSP20 family protein
MALIRRGPRGAEYQEPLGPWSFEWPELFRPFPPLRSLLGEEHLRIEEFTEDDTLVIRAELPGIDPDKDVEITVSDGMLHIRAERRQETKVEEKGQYRSEIRYGAFSRSLQLPTGATEKDIDATYKAGVLELRVPIDRKKAEATRIPIRTT